MASQVEVRLSFVLGCVSSFDTILCVNNLEAKAAFVQRATPQ